ncbi:alpha/beta fold hydrolase [Rhodococcus sp. CH91]|uniref:alpha/beta fold hydrolase n=1 Tax=Rhodococcus sp. CH91 TaxID=2910256 RepID=UPI001F4AF55F|nr:alpha/beta fold hydrolase [Rhodococcus sp. CH91]
MTTFALLPGAGSDAWYWHRVIPLLERGGHHTIAVELPYADETAGQYDYADVVVGAVRAAPRPLVVVAQSMSAFTAALVAERYTVDELVLVAPMIPSPGESPALWWENVGHAAARREQDVAEGRDPDAPMDARELFFHDVPEDLAAEALTREQAALADAAFEPAWNADRWPQVPVRVIAGRHDRLFPLPLVTRLSRERLGVEPEIVDSGHLPALARPVDLAQLLVPAT